MLTAANDSTRIKKPRGLVSRRAFNFDKAFNEVKAVPARD